MFKRSTAGGPSLGVVWVTQAMCTQFYTLLVPLKVMQHINCLLPREGNVE